MQDKSEKILKPFAVRLRFIRKRRDWTVAEMASLLGVSVRSVNNYEGGHSSPTSGQLRTFAEKLQVSLAYLQGSDEAVEVHERQGILRDEPAPISAGTEQQCREHFNQFMERCEHQETRLGWALEELRVHFPLDRWERTRVRY